MTQSSQHDLQDNPSASLWAVALTLHDTTCWVVVTLPHGALRKVAAPTAGAVRRRAGRALVAPARRLPLPVREWAHSSTRIMARPGLGLRRDGLLAGLRMSVAHPLLSRQHMSPANQQSVHRVPQLMQRHPTPRRQPRRERTGDPAPRHPAGADGRGRWQTATARTPACWSGWHAAPSARRGGATRPRCWPRQSAFYCDRTSGPSTAPPRPLG